METMRVPVDLESTVFWKLAGIAEKHDMKVGDYLVELACIASRRKAPMDSDPVVTRWREGFTDSQIAAELSATNQFVSNRRRSYGLPANRKK